MIKIYIDGAYQISKNIGGWAVVLLAPNLELIYSGAEKYTTSQRMEIRALLEGLKRFRVLKALDTINLDENTLEIYSDSKYVVNSAGGWIHNWIKKDFKGKQNIDLWKEYLELSKGLDIKFHWIRGHSGDYYNELCDSRATEAILNFKK